jgi:hypothetical protein
MADSECRVVSAALDRPLADTPFPFSENYPLLARNCYGEMRTCTLHEETMRNITVSISGHVY